MKRQTLALVCWHSIVSFLVLCPCVDASSQDFFRDKFICVQTVEQKAKDDKCLKCHSGILKEIDLSKNQEKDLKKPVGSPVVIIHAQHMQSGKVNFTCITCHQSIDPYQSSSAGIRNQVSANFCFKCHFPHGQE